MRRCTFLQSNGSFLSLGERRWSLSQDATTQGSPSPPALLDTNGFSSSISQTYHYKLDQYCIFMYVEVRRPMRRYGKFKLRRFNEYPHHDRKQFSTNRITASMHHPLPIENIIPFISIP